MALQFDNFIYLEHQGTYEEQLMAYISVNQITGFNLCILTNINKYQLGLALLATAKIYAKDDAIWSRVAGTIIV